MENQEIIEMEEMIKKYPEVFVSWTKSRRGRNYFRVCHLEPRKIAAIFSQVSTFRGRSITATIFVQCDGKKIAKKFRLLGSNNPAPEELFKAIPENLVHGKARELLQYFIFNPPRHYRDKIC